MSAVLSSCGRYRWRLDREISPAGIVIAFFGVNPSTAGPEIEDQTTMKWRGFAARNGARKYIAGNAFGYRATDVRELSRVCDPIGLENEVHLWQIVSEADVLVPCWGNREKLPKDLQPRLESLALFLVASGKPVKVFGLTKSGDPLHPLMLGYDTPLRLWGGP